MTKIVSFFGHKSSGKDSSALFIYGAWLHSLGLIKGGYCIKDDGLWVTDIMGHPETDGRFDPRRNDQTMKDFLAENVDPYIKLYSFAYDLKQFCINVLGLRYEQCYGTNEEKDSLTHLEWANMPGISDQKSFLKCGYNKYMTGREAMQYFGTEIVRKMYSPAWAKATLKRINEEQPLIALITDGRFQDELDEIKANSGTCIKLLRSIYKDNHSSESLDIKDEDFDYIIDNSNLTLDERNDKLVETLGKNEGILPEMEILG